MWLSIAFAYSAGKRALGPLVALKDQEESKPATEWSTGIPRWSHAGCRLPCDQAMDPFALVSLGARPGGGGNPCGRGKRPWMLQTPGRVCSSWAKSHARSKFGTRKHDKRSQHWVTNELGCLNVSFCESRSQVGLKVSAEVDLTSYRQHRQASATCQ